MGFHFRGLSSMCWSHTCEDLASASQILGLQVCTTYHAWLQTSFEYSFDYIPQSGITRSYGSSFIFLRNVCVVFLMAAVIYSSSTACQGSPPLLSLSLCLNLCALGNGEGAQPYKVLSRQSRPPSPPPCLWNQSFLLSFCSHMCVWKISCILKILTSWKPEIHSSVPILTLPFCCF